MNSRISTKERNLIKGALRRVFSRSELRRQALRAIVVTHSDPKRKRVKTWGKCPECSVLDAISNFEIDHSIPIIPVDKTLTDFTWDEIVSRIWCDLDNLRALCRGCHGKKTKLENKQRAQARKERKKNDTKTSPRTIKTNR